MKKPKYDWWVAHAHTDSAFLLLADSPHLFEEAIKSRLKQVGRPFDQGVVNQATFRACFEQDRFGGLSSILEAIQPVHEQPVFKPSRELTGPIGTDNRCFRDPAGTFCAWGVGAFWLPWSVKRDNRHHFDRFVEWAHAAQIDSVRMFGSHNWHGGCLPTEPGYWELMEKTLAEMKAVGLRVQVTLATRDFLIPDLDAYVREWATLIDSYYRTVLLAELVNESQHRDNGPWGNARVRDLASVFRTHAPETPLALSSPCSTERWGDMEPDVIELYEGCGANNVITLHFPRFQNDTEGWGRWVRQPYHLHDSGIAGNQARLIVSNEPQKWDQSEGGSVVEAAMCSVLNGWVCGMGLVNHHDQKSVYPTGSFGDAPHDHQLALVCRNVFPHIPDDLANWLTVRTGLPGHPFPDLVNQHYTFSETEAGTSRAYAAVREDAFVCVLTRVRKQVVLEEIDRSFLVLSLRSGEEVYSGNGPVTLSESQAEAYVVVG